MMKKYYIVLLLLSVMMGFSSCTLESAETVDPTQGPYLAYADLKSDFLEPAVFVMKEALLADQYASADGQGRNEMASEVFYDYHIAVLNGSVKMDNLRTKESDIAYQMENGQSLLEVGARWVRTSKSYYSPKRICLECMAENTWKLVLYQGQGEELSRYGEMILRAVSTDVALLEPSGPWGQQFEVLEISGSTIQTGSHSFYDGTQHYLDRQTVEMEFEIAEPFGVYFDGTSGTYFDGGLHLVCRSSAMNDVDFTATFGTWTDKNVCIRWLENEKVWRQ